MSKALQDGLIMDDSFLIIDEKKPGFRISARVIQFLAVIIGSYSAFWVFLHSLSAPVNIYYINAAILICTVVLFLLCIFPSYDMVKLSLGGLFYCLFLFSRLPELKNGIYLFENMVIYKLYAYYGYSSYYFLADTTTQIADTTLLTIMIMIPVISLFTIAVVRNRLVNLCCLILFLPVGVSFLLGVIPSERYLIAYIAAILYLAKTGLPFRSYADRKQRTLLHRISSRAAVWMSLLGLMIFLILKLFIPEEKYANIAQLNDMKATLQQTVAENSLQDISQQLTNYRLFDYDAASGGLMGGMLNKGSDVEFTGTEQLVINAPLASVLEGIYLKGYVGSEYTGSKWTGHTREDKTKYNELLEEQPSGKFAPVNQMNSLLKLMLNRPPELEKATQSQYTSNDQINSSLYQISQGKMQVEYKAANKRFIYAPYYTDYDLLDRAYYEEDLYSAPSIQSDYYEFNYLYNCSIFNPGNALIGNEDVPDYTRYERLYRPYVYEVYTKLPEKGLDRLKEQFANQPALKTLKLTDKLDYVRNYLRHNTQYTLSPGKVPKGKDFVEYFLFENKKGYCAHYASSAVLMLRAMGVPARYIEGYAVGPQQLLQNTSAKEVGIALDQSASETQIGDTTVTVTGMDTDAAVTVTVSDKDAHAWVEVYIDGCGWVPVEFTPGAVMEYNTSEISGLSNTQVYLESSVAAVSPELTPEPTQAVPNQEQEDTNNQEQTKIEAAADAKEAAKLNAGFITAFLLLTAATAGLLMIITVKNRRKLKRTRNINKRAVLMFAEIEKILSVSRGLPNKKARLEDSVEYVKEQSSYLEPEQFCECMETVKKARFGKGSISVKELKQVEEFRKKLYNEVYHRLPPHKKLGLKLLMKI